MANEIKKLQAESMKVSTAYTAQRDLPDEPFVPTERSAEQDLAEEAECGCFRRPTRRSHEADHFVAYRRSLRARKRLRRGLRLLEHRSVKSSCPQRKPMALTGPMRQSRTTCIAKIWEWREGVSGLCFEARISVVTFLACEQ